MAIKTTFNYSPNFNSLRRTKKQINYVIIHYTGMKRESLAIKRLTNIQSEVSSHYLIKNNGDILTLVPDLYVAWHAGKSNWKNFKSLNDSSIGIEISNPGHKFNYKYFNSKQIKSLIKIIDFLKKKYKIKKKNILGHSDIAPDRKKDPGEKFPWKYLAKKNIGFWHDLKNQILIESRNKKVDSHIKKQFFKYINKIGYSKKIENNFSKRKNNDFIIKAFQRRFRQELINGKIDQECFLISKNLSNLIK
tara:strand:- start:86 stop:829 length:744 start_codon:yes stop_codon:yes gene_type:complete